MLRGSTVIAVSGTRKALVAALLLRANEPVTIDLLIEDLWGDAPPPTAVKMIRNAVSALRRLLPKGTLVTRPGGYELVVEPERVDAVRFERLAAAGRDALAAGEPAEAVALLREALELWHGRPLVDFAYSQFAHAAIARLEELRVAALEDRIDAELQLGRHADVVGDLEALVREQPLSERPRSQLMLALYRSGRQTEALAAYQQARMLLADELGLEPSPALRSLEQSILRHDPALQPESRPTPSRVLPAMAETRREIVVVSVLVTPPPDVVDAEARRQLLAAARVTAAAVLERHGAEAEALHSGALMGVFGVPVVHEDDSLRALRAAVELRAHAEANGTILQLGLDAGASIVLATEEGRHAVDGEVIASAARLAQSARPGEVLVGPGAERLVRGAARLEAGQGAWRLLQIVPDAPAIVRRFDTELVGRERELDALSARFERCVIEQAPQLFTVLGAPGIGKSKLAREFAASLEGSARVLQGHCLPYGDGVTFWPLREIVRALGADAHEAIAHVFAGEPDQAAAVGRIAAAIGAGEAVGGSREETFRAVRSMLEGVAAEKPLVLVLEDVHWAEPTFLDLVDHVVELAREAPLFVLCLGRPELLERRPFWAGGRPQIASILLEPLGDHDADRLIDNLLVGRPLDPLVRARIVESAEGNALFLEQMLALLAEDGGHATTVPPSLQALLASRVDRLPQPERALLERAAVAGRSFSVDAVRVITPEYERPETELLLEQLVRRGLVQPDRSGPEDLRFVHGLIRDVVYESIPKQTRAALHERCAVRLESDRGGPEPDELVGHHLEQAHRYRTELGMESPELAARAAERLARAGRSAYLRGDAPAAAGFFGRAVALVEPEATDRPGLLVELADALRESGRFEPAAEVVTELETIAAGRDDPTLKALALVCRHRLLLMTSSGFDVERLEREAIAATEVFERAGDDRLLAKAWELRAVEAWFQCRAGTAEDALAQAILHAHKAGDERTEVQSIGLSIGAAVFGPLPVEKGLLRCEAILARQPGRRRIVAAALRASAALAAMQGDFATARERLAESREMLEDLGLVLAAAQAAETAGTIEFLAGDPVSAEAELRAGYGQLERMGDTSMRANLAALLAQSLSEQRRDSEALLLTKVAEQAASAGDLSAQVHWQSSRTRALVGLGRREEAELFGRRAVALAERTDFLNVHADALLALALAARDASDAIAAVAEAVELYERKGNVVSAATAFRLIASSDPSWRATR